MLADQGLWHRQRVDEFVHATRRLAQLEDDRDPHRGGQRAQQIPGGVEHVARRQIRERTAAVLVIVLIGGWTLFARALIGGWMLFARALIGGSTLFARALI